MSEYPNPPEVPTPTPLSAEPEVVPSPMPPPQAAVESNQPPGPVAPPANKDKWYASRWLIGVAAFLLGAAIATAASGGSGTDSAAKIEADSLTLRVQQLQGELNAANATVAAQQAQLDAAAATPAPAPKPAPAAPKTYTDGVYLVGTDIQAGRYKGIVTGGTGYWKISSDPNGSNIIENSIPTGPFYVAVKKGQYLELSGVEIHKVE